ncbi:MAG: PspC domain-containing protein [Alistipes sp.]|nr:PspC domain-containing protein [Alistipes sp.]
MKETINADIGSVAFTVDRDAYLLLDEYLDDVRSRLSANVAETMDDIERRFAEIFQERISSPMQVVTIETVRAAIERMGKPSDFGEQLRPSDSSRQPALRRSRTNRSIAGICAGLAEFFGADVTLIRIVTLLLILFGGLSIWIYIVLWIVIPEAPAPKFTMTDKKR